MMFEGGGGVGEGTGMNGSFIEMPNIANSTIILV